MRVFVSTFGSAGDTLPFVRLAAALLARGHAVTVHTWSQYLAWFSDGCERVASGYRVSPEELDRMFDDSVACPSPLEQVRVCARYFYGLGQGDGPARAYYARCREAIAGHDLAVCNTLDHLAQAAADAAGVRCTLWASRPPVPPTADDLFRDIDRDIGALVSAASGSPRRVRAFRDRSRVLDVVAASPALALPVPQEPRLAITGSWLASGPPAALPAEIEDFLAAGPALLIALGATPDHTGRTVALADAAVRAGWRALVQVLAPTPRELPSWPHVMVTRAHVSHPALFARVAAVVFHGGSGTAHEIGRAGRPAVAIPHLGDQYYWAHAFAIRELGPPALARDRLEPDAVVATLRALRDPAYTARARRIADLMAGEDGVGATVGLLERL
jgi:UDP:flavonoid glycosyltransferase YjiC (YdhE family)